MKTVCGSAIRALAVVSFFLFSSMATAEVLVIVNPANSSELDQGTIEKLFLGKQKSFSNGDSVTLLTLPESNSATEEFLTTVVGKDGAQFQSFWAKLVFTGKGTPPEEVKNENEMVANVAENPKAIGFVPSGTNVDGVKVIGTF